MKRPRIIAADDHRIVVEGLRSLLEPEFELVSVVADGRELIEKHDQVRPDLIIADVGMPHLNGIQAMRKLREAGSKTRFVFLTMHPDPEYAAEALESGASGYVLKHSAPEELVAAVREALAGRTYITPRIAAEVLKAMRGGASSARLTSRQAEVLQLLAEGRSAKEVAAALDISPRTVESHKYAIMEVLGVKTSAELVREAVKRGLVCD